MIKAASKEPLDAVTVWGMACGPIPREAGTGSARAPRFNSAPDARFQYGPRDGARAVPERGIKFIPLSGDLPRACWGQDEVGLGCHGSQEPAQLRHRRNTASVLVSSVGVRGG